MGSSKGKVHGILFAALCATALAASLAGCATGSGERTVVVSEGGASPTITVTANSEVSVVPDKAEVGIALTSQAATAMDAQEQNTAGASAVIDALEALGIDEKSIQTTDVYLNPRYDYSGDYASAEPAIMQESATSASTVGSAEGETLQAEEPAVAGQDTAAVTEPASDGTNIVGYEMTTRLAVSDLDIDEVGKVVSTCVEAGANSVDGIRYYSSEYDAKYAEALAIAVEDAYAKAEALAEAGGVTLGGVYSMTEGYQNTAYRYDTGAAMEAASADAAMKVMPGEVNVTASVTVSYELA